MAYRALSPLIVNNFIDSCAFDPKYEPEASAAFEIFKLSEGGDFQLQIAHSTQKEIDRLWADEVEDRIDAYERGDLKAIPGEEVFRRLKPREKK